MLGMKGMLSKFTSLDKALTLYIDDVPVRIKKGKASNYINLNVSINPFEDLLVLLFSTFRRTLQVLIFGVKATSVLRMLATRSSRFVCYLN